MNDQAVRLGPGVRVSYDGDVIEVVELSGTRVTVRNERTGQFLAVGLARLVSGCRAVPAVDTDATEAGDSIAVTLAGLNRVERAEVAERAAHVREVLTGYRAGHPDAAASGEPPSGIRPGRAAVVAVSGQGRRARDRASHDPPVGRRLPPRRRGRVGGHPHAARAGCSRRCTVGRRGARGARRDRRRLDPYEVGCPGPSECPPGCDVRAGRGGASVDGDRLSAAGRAIAPRSART
jgi:hypothetical protein